MGLLYLSYNVIKGILGAVDILGAFVKLLKVTISFVFSARSSVHLSIFRMELVKFYN